MKMEEFCGNIEFLILQFTFSFTEQIRKKVAQKELFYKEQIERYVQKQINYFLKGLNLKGALISAYKHEVYNTIMFKLKKFLQEQKILRCI